MTFFDDNLLLTEYLRKLKQVDNPHRSYQALKDTLEFIYEYKKEHALSFTKRIKSQQKDVKNCEAVFAEVIVYGFYLRLVYEGIINSLDIKENDYDLRIELSGHSFLYLEIFSIMPEHEISTLKEGKLVPLVNTPKTHLSLYKSSAYQKLLYKIKKQKQLTKPRENFVVIEVNDLDGIAISCLTPIFYNASTKYVKGIILFTRGNYNKREYISNPNFQQQQKAF